MSRIGNRKIEIPAGVTVEENEGVEPLQEGVYIVDSWFFFLQEFNEIVSVIKANANNIKILIIKCFIKNP